MKFGLYFKNSNGLYDWIREPDRSISIWSDKGAADSWRKTHTVSPAKYEVKKVTPKVIKEDRDLFA